MKKFELVFGGELIEFGFAKVSRNSTEMLKPALQRVKEYRKQRNVFIVALVKKLWWV